MKRILFALATLIITGMIGAGLGFGTELVHITNPHYRVARKLTADVENLEVINIYYNDEADVLSMMMILSGTTPGSQPYIEEAFVKLIEKDSTLLIAFLIYHFPEGYIIEGEASDYWVAGLYTIEAKSLGLATWTLEMPYSLGIWIPITEDIVDGWRMW